MNIKTAENEIRIFDTTLRDGEQAPGCSLNLMEKIEIAKQLNKLNVDVIGLVMSFVDPIISSKEF